MSSVGLQLLSLYKEINDNKNMTNNRLNPTTSEEMVKTIRHALERGNYNEAYGLLGEWTMKFPLDNEDGLEYYYLYVQLYLQEMDTTEDNERYFNILNNVIDTANIFFFVNSYDGNHRMDNEAYELYLRLTEIIASLNGKKQIDAIKLGLSAIFINLSDIIHAFLKGNPQTSWDAQIHPLLSFQFFALPFQMGYSVLL